MTELPLKAQIFSDFLIFVEENEKIITDDHYDSGMPDMPLHVFAATRFLWICNEEIKEGNEEIQKNNSMIIAIMFDLIDFLEKNQDGFESEYLEFKRSGGKYPWLIFPYVQYANKVLKEKEYETDPA